MFWTAPAAARRRTAAFAAFRRPEILSARRAAPAAPKTITAGETGSMYLERTWKSMMTYAAGRANIQSIPRGSGARLRSRGAGNFAAACEAPREGGDEGEHREGDRRPQYAGRRRRLSRKERRRRRSPPCLAPAVRGKKAPVYDFIRKSQAAKRGAKTRSQPNLLPTECRAGREEAEEAKNG